MINGNQYSYESIELMLNGKLIAATGIEYTTKRDLENKYVLGQTDPVAIVKGKKGHEGEITLTHDEVIRLQNSIPKGADFTDITGLIVVVSYLDESGIVYTDRLVNVCFTEHGKSFEAENSHFDKSFPITIGKVLYNV